MSVTGRGACPAFPAAAHSESASSLALHRCRSADPWGPSNDSHRTAFAPLLLRGKSLARHQFSSIQQPPLLLWPKSMKNTKTNTSPARPSSHGRLSYVSLLVTIGGEGNIPDDVLRAYAERRTFTVASVKQSDDSSPLLRTVI